MFNRWIEAELLDVLEAEGAGCIPFSPLAQGLLTDKYLDGVPEGSRATQGKSLSGDMLSDDEPRTHPGAQRHRPASWPVARPDGHPVDAA